MLLFSAFSSIAEERTIVFDTLGDGLALASGLGAAVGTELALSTAATSFAKPDIAGLRGLDAVACLPYNAGAATASELGQYATMLWPALFAISAEGTELLPAAITYAEALSWTYAAKNCLKYFFPKERPYAYYSDSLSGDLLAESNQSFPSGHTALAFCAATSFAVLSLELAGDEAATPWLVAGGYALATSVGVLRVVSGNHFIGDVAAGALLGSAIGYGVSIVHIKPKTATSAVSMGDSPLLIKIRL
jgi:Membrane-associated phospholipid phosphatase